MCVCVCMSFCTWNVCRHWLKPEDSVGSLRSGVAGGHEPPAVGVGNWTRSLWKERAVSPLNGESSLQHSLKTSCWHIAILHDNGFHSDMCVMHLDHIRLATFSFPFPSRWPPSSATCSFVNFFIGDSMSLIRVTYRQLTSGYTTEKSLSFPQQPLTTQGEIGPREIPLHPCSTMDYR